MGEKLDILYLTSVFVLAQEKCPQMSLPNRWSLAGILLIGSQFEWASGILQP